MESTIGPYRLLRKISRGGMGTVYEAIHTTIERRVAIKVLDSMSARSDDLAVRFLNEARAVNRVNDPGLVQMFDHGQLRDGTAYIVMEFLEGETLSRRLRRMRRRMPVQDILRLLRQTAETLAATHQKGIIHRDLKPDNIMIVRDPAVAGGERTKVLDFGIAKLRESAPTKAANTHKDLLMGTPSYMSPEQCRGAGGVDEKTDVYSLGVVLYRALAGRPPFVAQGAGDTMAQHIYQEPPPLRDHAPWLPESVTSLVHRMLHKDKDARPSMADIATSLGQLASELSDFVLPELPEEGSLSGALSIQAGGDESSAPSQPLAAVDGEGSDDDEDEALDTIAVSESAQSIPVDERLLDGVSTSQSAPSVLGWSIANTGQGRTAHRLGAMGRWLGIVATGLLLLGGIVALRVTWPSRQVAGGADSASATSRVESPATKPQPTQPNTPARVVWKLESTPPGAEIVRVSDGQVLGRTPWSAEKPAESGVEEIRLRLAGHAEHMVSLQRNANSHSSVALSPLPVAPATSPTALEPRPAPDKNRSKNRKRGHVKIVLED